jgi:branched-chain amino acid aminotransferase
MNDLICWYDGKYKSLSTVSISPLEFGFIHSDATYDVLRIKNGKIMFADLHLDRFKNSCKYFYFTPIDHIELIADTLIEKNQITNAFLWAAVWRGVPPTGSPRDINAPQHSLIYVKPYYGISADGITACINRDNRRTPDLSHSQEYKNFAWIEFNRAQRNAVSNGYDTAFLLTIDDYISEGPGFGICFVKNGIVLTPFKDVLKSVTVSVIEQLCKEAVITFSRTNITEEDALDADECFVCSTSGGITPVKKLNNREYTHELTLKLKNKYDNLS